MHSLQPLTGRPTSPARALVPADLPVLESFLQQADLDTLITRQPVCAIVGDADPRAIFESVLVSSTALAEVALPNVDLTSDAWLYRRLTRTLDRRMLALLGRRGVPTDGPFVVRLNVATVLQPNFVRFAERHVDRKGGAIVVGFDLLDVFSDYLAYLAACEVLRRYRQRVCIRDISAFALHLLDREQLGADFLKVAWDPALATHPPDPFTGNFLAAVARNGQSRVILDGCTGKDAIDFGRRMGLTLFQGTAVDAPMAAPASAAGNPFSRRPRRRKAAA